MSILIDWDSLVGFSVAVTVPVRPNKSQISWQIDLDGQKSWGDDEEPRTVLLFNQFLN